MGKKNKQRRAAKKRQRQRAAARAGTERQRTGQQRTGQQAGQHQPHEQPQRHKKPPMRIEDLVHAAIRTWQTDESGHADALDALDARASKGEPVLATVTHTLHDTLGYLWERGWTPSDVVHVTGRRLTAVHADVIASAILADGQSRIGSGQAVHPRWREQLDVLSARRRSTARQIDSAVRLAVTVLCILMRLSAVPPTMPNPGSPDAALSNVKGLDQRMLARVRALLAKAESTEFDEEAEALTAKAQELIARHSIAEALLQTPDDVGEPSVRRILLDDPYVEAKATLLAKIADANRCRTVYDAFSGWTTVFGYDRDLDAVELLAASLLAQATSAMARHGSRQDSYGRSTTRSFRRSFLVGFAVRIGERLREATDSEVAASDSQHGRLLPVLSAREDRVRAAQETTFPATEHRRTSISNATGWFAGQAAADLANLEVSAGRLDQAS
jgi:hypothetical protein